MKKMLIIITMVLLGMGFNYAASAWIYVPDQGDTGWKSYTYTAASGGFTGSAGFVVSNVIDAYAYSELLLDNLSHGGGGTNLGFESGLMGYDVLPNSAFADVYTSRTSALGTVYYPTESYFLADLMGLTSGVDTSGFHNASGQPGTVGSILETALTLNPAEQFSFDWAFLGNDFSPWNDFALFYLKNANGGIVFSEGLAQIGSAPSVPLPSSLLLLGSGLFGLLGLGRRAKRRIG